MPTYEYECSQEHSLNHFCAMSEKPDTLECPECGEDMHSIISGGTGFVLKGHFPGKRIQEVDARKRRQAWRIEQKLESGEMTQKDVDKMASIRDKFSSTSPYLLDPTKDGKQDPRPDDPSAGNFHDEQEV